jgi:hypothetical protein
MAFLINELNVLIVWLLCVCLPCVLLSWCDLCISGPDIMMQAWTDPTSTKALGYMTYLQQFVLNCSMMGVDLYAVTHHEYLEIMAYATTPPPATLLDDAGIMGRAIRAAIHDVAPNVKVWAGEIGPHPGRSPGCDHSSLRWSNWADT